MPKKFKDSYFYNKILPFAIILIGILIFYASIQEGSDTSSEINEIVTDSSQSSKYINSIIILQEVQKNYCSDSISQITEIKTSCNYQKGQAGYEKLLLSFEKLLEECNKNETIILTEDILKKNTEQQLKKLYDASINVEETQKTSIESGEKMLAICQKNKPYELNQPIIAGDFKWKITGMNKQSEIGESIFGTFLGVEADGEFLIIDVEVENIGNSAKYLTDSFIKLVDDREREFSSDMMAAIYLKPQGSSLTFDTINPGIIKKGKIVFDVPKDLNIVDVRISDSLISSTFYTVKLIS